jgi:hypothetical protein
MAKFAMTKFQKHKHERAFELYCETDAQGKRRSNVILGGLVGVSASAIAYWKRRDQWDAKILATLDDEINEADLTNRSIKKLLRESLYNHIKSLNHLIAYCKNEGDKIAAIKAFVHIAKELECLTPDTGAATEPPPAPSFKDDIYAQQPPAQEAQLSEGAAGTGASIGSASSPVGSPAGTVDLPVVAIYSAASVSAVHELAAGDPAGSDLDGVFDRLGI